MNLKKTMRLNCNSNSLKKKKKKKKKKKMKIKKIKFRRIFFKQKILYMKKNQE